MKNKMKPMKAYPRPGGIPEYSIFCQACGHDVDSSSTDTFSYCDCKENAIMGHWVAKTADMIHLFQSLNYMIVDEEFTAQSSMNKNIFYEL